MVLAVQTQILLSHIVHFEDGSISDKFQMDEAGLEKIRNYFIKGVPTK